MSGYDAIARVYDPWSVGVTEDVQYYVDLAVEAVGSTEADERAQAPASPAPERELAGGPVVELGVGTGRIAVPTAAAGVPVIGVDSSAGMLEVCRERAELAGVGHLVDLRVGDLCRPPVTERVRLVTSPFRSFLHLPDDEQRLAALRAARNLLVPGGRLAFDVFEPSREDIEETQGRWLEREPGIFERADWNERDRTLTLSVRGDEGETTMSLSWISPGEWRALLERAGFTVEGCFGWFDARPYAGGEDTVWIARRPAA